jgi:hypothetical protein
MPGGTTAYVKKADIESRKETTTSFMPTGIFDTLSLSQVADFVKYLASPAQMPLAVAQLFWVSVKLGDTLTLTLPDVAPGMHDLPDDRTISAAIINHPANFLPAKTPRTWTPLL